jgi:nitrogen fixation NifU-like protein
MQQGPDIPDVPLEGLYGKVIMDHYRHPRHHNPVSDADVAAEEFNPFCGDKVSVQLKLDSVGRVTQVGSQAQGCSIIQASASVMAQVIEGKTLEKLEVVSSAFRNMMQGKHSSSQELLELEGLEVFQGVRRYPVRIKCVLLPWTALEEGIQDFRKRSDPITLGGERGDA